MSAFLAELPSRYAAVNRATIDWMLARPALAHGFLNTKRNSVTLADYGPADGTAGPDFLYGWIQSRGLDALVHHAAAAGDTAPLSWQAAIGRLREALPRLRDTGGQAYFCYDAASLRPLRLTPEGAVPQVRTGEIRTPSDIYLATALAVADIARGGDGAAELQRLREIATAIEEKRFLIDETLPIGAESLERQADPGFAPMMTLLAGVLSLARCGRPPGAEFALGLIERVFRDHFDSASGLLRVRPGEDICAGGLALEFAGFALGYCALAGESGPVRELVRLATSTFRHCFTGLGIPTWTSFDQASRHSGLFAWWPLVEAIRAFAFGHELTGDADCLAMWEQADSAFFAHYWRPEASVAYQMRDPGGPVQRPPATPDLDPGYHTGLSLLDAAGVARRLVSAGGAGGIEPVENHPLERL